MVENKIVRRNFVKKLSFGGVGLSLLGQPLFSIAKNLPKEDLKVGLVGLSVHSAAFSKILNDPNKKKDLFGCKMVALYHPPGNPDVDFTPEQLSSYQKDVEEMGVTMVESMEHLIEMVDVVMIETNDGRPHMKEVLPALKAGKPVFVDKPVAEDLQGVVDIYKEAEKYGVPIFSSSALRYMESAQNINPSEVISAHTFSPAALEKSHTDLFWYGIHGIEYLFTVMGPGCVEVQQVQHSEAEDLVIGHWKDGRVGVFRGIREGKRDFGGTVFKENEIVDLGSFKGYRSLVVKVVEFFLQNKAPVSAEETFEIYAFMEAAQESKNKGGKKISLDKVLKKALK
ncbi:Gfo/Idh/MocA family protein [Cyclobacterium qasimii]|uniref:Oxidoreductase n=2 Tax=Cyclobacterium qasimii TaxID=1350429 RepID=A0A512CFX0_9BACT|nr:Gfo/Idh/MocA family oxidoreductase [Cyclobacterium qasimii]EPR67854.1 putative dehydrogenase [Cyclobacterium qasimii M12-11B]GEO23112.1 oxidoreductase [Cyclobacterium qasimii]